MAVTYHSSPNLFVGHLALAYAAKRWVPHISLAVLFAAVQLADLIWPVLVAAGLERVRIAPGITAATPLEFISYPYSHSLLTLSVWGALFAFAAAPRDTPVARNAPVVLFALVVSHWLLDVITHTPDMPLYPGGPEFGLGLWNSVAGTLLVELTMFAIGVWIYAHTTAARDATGRWVTWGLVAFLAIGFLAAGTPPPSVTALWMSALGGGAIILALAWWGDLHREAKSTVDSR